MTLAWILFIIYMLFTTGLGWLGYKKTADFSSFAIGAGDLHPAIVGITMASSVASAATFIINPGFVYVHGLAGFLHLSLSVGLGFCLMLVLLSFRFRRFGSESGALTMPNWINYRYQSTGFGMFFAVVNLFSLAFVVLIVGGLSIVMQQLLGLSNVAALIIILGFVTGYVFLGGTYAHVFTNTLQGTLMLLVTLVILFSGLYLFFSDSGFLQLLSEQDPNLIAPVNPESNLYNSVFSIYVSGFIIGAALVCQPHILTKALYLKTDKAVRRYLVYGVVFLAIFFLLPFAGFYARLVVPPEQLIDPATNLFRQDQVMTAYVMHAFPEWLSVVISVVLLAAGMSTLDGILVSISTITANDLILAVIDRRKGDENQPQQRLALAYRYSHFVLIAVAVIAFLICLDPPRLLGIFGQVGVYGMAVAAATPLVLGISFKEVEPAIAWGGAVVGLATHLILYLYGDTLLPDSGLTFANPAVTATLAMLLSLFPAILLTWMVTGTLSKLEKKP